MMKEEEVEAVKTAARITNLALTIYSTYGVSWKKAEQLAKDIVLKNAGDNK